MYSIGYLHTLSTYCCTPLSLEELALAVLLGRFLREHALALGLVPSFSIGPCHLLLPSWGENDEQINLEGTDGARLNPTPTS
jgi:hypothetical protein